MVADSWDAGGPRYNPRELADWTPHQIQAVFCRAKAGANGGTDQVTALAGHNRRRADKRQMPESPSWFLPDIKG